MPDSSLIGAFNSLQKKNTQLLTLQWLQITNPQDPQFHPPESKEQAGNGK